MNVLKLPSSVARLYLHLQNSYALDPRSLAVFRIAVGLVALYEIFTRFQLRHAFYTDAGILPRRDAVQTVTSAQWSLLMMNGSSAFVTVVFIVAIVAAILFTVGWKTRIASIVLWAVVLSIQTRNPYLNNGGDVLLRAVMFWAMFLPLGQMWSLDARQSIRSGKIASSAAAVPVFSIAAVALIAQQFVVYFCTALLKTDAQWKVEGSALYYALGLRDYSNGLGDWIFHNASPDLLRVLTYLALMIEYVAPLLIILPFAFGPFRTLGALMIVGLHFGIMTTMTVGLFPFISIASVLGVLPSWFWESLLPKLSAIGERLGIPQLASPRHETSRNTGVARPPSPGPGTTTAGALHFVNRLPKLELTWNMAGHAVVLVALVSMLLSNLSFVSSYNLPEPAWNVTHATGLRQKWNMFAPKPVMGSRWYIAEGELASGKKVDLLVALDKGDMSLQVPSEWNQSDEIKVKSKLWRKYFASIRNKDVRIHRFAAYTCRTWNDTNTGDDKLVQVTVARGYAKTLPDTERAEPVYDRWVLWNCGS